MRNIFDKITAKCSMSLTFRCHVVPYCMAFAGRSAAGAPDRAVDIAAGIDDVDLAALLGALRLAAAVVLLARADVTELPIHLRNPIKLTPLWSSLR